MRSFEFPEPYADDRLLLDFRQRVVILDNQRLTLRRKEFDLLAMLVQHAAETVGRCDLLRHIWDYGAEIRTRTLDVHIRRLRKQFGVCGERHIETIFGIGYRFQPFHSEQYPAHSELPSQEADPGRPEMANGSTAAAAAQEPRG